MVFFVFKDPFVLADCAACATRLWRLRRPRACRCLAVNASGGLVHDGRRCAGGALRLRLNSNWHRLQMWTRPRESWLRLSFHLARRCLDVAWYARCCDSDRPRAWPCVGVFAPQDLVEVSWWVTRVVVCGAQPSATAAAPVKLGIPSSTVLCVAPSPASSEALLEGASCVASRVTSTLLDLRLHKGVSVSVFWGRSRHVRCEGQDPGSYSFCAGTDKEFHMQSLWLSVKTQHHIRRTTANLDFLCFGVDIGNDTTECDGNAR